MTKRILVNKSPYKGASMWRSDSGKARPQGRKSNSENGGRVQRGPPFLANALTNSICRWVSMASSQ